MSAPERGVAVLEVASGWTVSYYRTPAEGDADPPMHRVFPEAEAAAMVDVAEALSRYLDVRDGDENAQWREVMEARKRLDAARGAS